MILVPRGMNGIVGPAFGGLVVEAIAPLRSVLHDLAQEITIDREYGLQEARHIGEHVVSELADNLISEPKRIQVEI